MQQTLSRSIALHTLTGALLLPALTIIGRGSITDQPLLPLWLLLMGALLGVTIGYLRHRFSRRLRERNSLVVGIIESLSTALEERDHYLRGHSERVTELALSLGRANGLDRRSLQDLHLAAILHDIGKIGVPDAILRKPAALTGEERSALRSHPERGERIIARINHPRLKGVIEAIRHHHERHDGSGYPDAIEGKAIPELARILAIADSFDAMTSDRPYRKRITPEEGLKEIARCAGSQFDPDLAELFIQIQQRTYLRRHDAPMMGERA